MDVQSLNSGVKNKGKKDRSVYRKKKYNDPDPLCCNFNRPCSHKEKSKFKCRSFHLTDIIENRKQFFKFDNKTEQDRYLTRFLCPYEPLKRGTSAPRSTTRNRNISCKYYLKHGKKMVPVCMIFFIKTFSIGQKRIKNLNKTLFAGGIPKENRGGDRKSSKTRLKKENLRKFIKGLPASESHYTRDKSKRIYLESELNCKKLLNFYNRSAPQELRVSRTMFHEIFTKEFNIGFKQPASDVCNVCILWSNKIKRATNSSQKQTLITEKRVHKLRANAFYEHMKAKVPDSISFCFDMQKVQPLPKTPIQDAYARQLSLYNAGMVGLNTRNPKCYTWLECDSGRGSVEAGSALYSFLNNVEYPPEAKILRLFCDGCGGQNKNSHIVHILMYWLINKAPQNIKEICLFYPVRGHSFLPADRVFARLEKEIKKTQVITTKEGYYSIFEKQGDLKILGSDWSLYDIKGLEEHYKKLSAIQTYKRIVLKKNRRTGCSVTAFENFRFESGNEPIQSLLKKGKRHPTVMRSLQSGQKGLPAAKKRDVTNLLIKQFGDDWAEQTELLWYRQLLLDETNTMNDESLHHCETEYCECMEPDVKDLRV